MKILPTSLRRRAIEFCRKNFAASAVRRRVELPHHGYPVSLHMVLSRDGLLMGQLMLRSLEFHSGLSWAPVLHDDGSLTDSDVAEIRANFPDATVIRRSEADSVLGEALAAYPLCRNNRLKHPWFLKVFDTRQFAPHDRYIVIDSDIVFFRRPDFVLDWMEKRPETLWFMEDAREKYSSDRAGIEAAMGVPLWERVNSGLDLLVRPYMDLALAETFMERCAPLAREFHFLEQTFFAVIGSVWGKGGRLPREYEISWTNFHRPRAVCRHYIGPSKNDALFIEGASDFWWRSRFFHPRSARLKSAPQP
ncbi:MAG: hypothetical protein WC003_00670 [Terrimicrobiaceae bacterium]